MHPRLTGLFGIGCLLGAGAAGAVEVAVRVEPSAALPLAEPQRSKLGAGGGAIAAGLFRFAPFLEGQAQLGGLLLPPAEGSSLSAPGTALLFGAGLRATPPSAEGASWTPWLDGTVFYGRTAFLNQLSFSAGAGVLWRLPGPSGLRLGPNARYVHVTAPGEQPGYLTAPAHLLLLGLSLEGGVLSSPPPDRDGDGVPDEKDACPEVAGGGGLECPPTPAAPLVDLDSDGDGVPDGQDKCPKLAGTSLGCPADTDGDGLPDAEDQCPRETGAAATRGCPDTDGDGVADSFDACPKAKGLVEAGGCPRYEQVVVTDTRLEIRQKIHFAYGLAAILPKSFPLLDQVAQALKDHARLCVQVEGHTDATGNPAQNLRLSGDRSASVMEHLVSRGVEAERLRFKGYGSSLPLEDNRTSEGRERNRRVEFVIVPCGGKEGS